jgi:20S proteasome alpha/beta subunit
MVQVIMCEKCKNDTPLQEAKLLCKKCLNDIVTKKIELSNIELGYVKKQNRELLKENMKLRSKIIYLENVIKESD